jgi:hypothetical protein
MITMLISSLNSVIKIRNKKTGVISVDMTTNIT